MGEFDALAAGEGSEQTIALLLAGEYSRRQLLLRLLLDTVREPAVAGAAVTGDLPSLDAAWELLVHAQRRDPDAVRDLLMHPHIGMWAAHTIRVLRGSMTDEAPEWVHLGHLHAIAAAAAIRVGLDFEFAVPVRAGAAFLPTLGAVAVRTDRSWAVAEVVRRSGVTRVGAGPHSVIVPDDPTVDAPGWQGYRQLAVTANGLALTVDLDDIDPYRGLFGNKPPERLDEPAVKQWLAALDAAWALLVSEHEPQARELAAGLRALVPVRPAGRFRPHSASAGDSFGSATVSVPDDPTQLAITLVHEFQHTKLNGLLHLVTMYADGGDPRLYAPWRDDPRPLGGLLQGAYAFLGVTRFYQIRRRLDTGTARELAHFEFALWRRQTEVAIQQLRAQPQLTALGHRFVDGLAGTLRPWLAEEVPAGIETAAEVMAADHAATWRAYHRQPDERWVAGAVTAWLAGQPAPAAAESTVATDETAQWLDTRAVLTRVQRTDPPAFAALRRTPSEVDKDVAGSTPADVAYVAGDFGTAEQLYLAELSGTPDRAAAWPGLGLTLRAAGAIRAGEALLDRPEVARAVHRAIVERGADRRPSPVELAEWLAGAS